jgi:hypothetical protein
VDLPVEFQSELELSRIVSCRWLPGQARGARRGIAQLVHCGDVGVIGKVESIGDQVEAEAFTDVDCFGDAQQRRRAGINGQFLVQRSDRQCLQTLFQALERNGHAKVGGKSRGGSESHLRGVATGNKARKRMDSDRTGGSS